MLASEKQYAKCFQPGKNWCSVKLAGAPIVCGSEPVMGALENSTRNNHSSVGSSSDVLSVTLEIRPKVLLKRMLRV